MRVTSPGDRFKSSDEAAIDFAKLYNDNSIKNNTEYATTIYKVTTSSGEFFYSYSEPNKGSEAAATPSGTGWIREDVADAHTHGKYLPAYDNNNFSPTDTKDNNKKNLIGYLATPNGSLQKYDPETKLTTVVATDIPSDPKDPQRLNNVDYAPLPKNEPTRTFRNFLRDNFVVPFSGNSFRITGPILPMRLIF